MRRFAILSAITALMVGYLASPAQALYRVDDLVLAGSGSKVIQVRLTLNHASVPEDPPYRVFFHSRIWFGSQATSATNCKITGWVRLANLDLTSQWTSRKVTYSCADALPRNGGAGQWYWRDGDPIWTHYLAGTNAVWSRARVCVDLYYNGSTSSGLQLCGETPGWVVGS